MGEDGGQPHTILNLGEVEDAAPANGFSERWEARVARQPLGAESTGVTYFRLHPGRRSASSRSCRRSRAA